MPPRGSTGDREAVVGQVRWCAAVDMDKADADVEVMLGQGVYLKVQLNT